MFFTINMVYVVISLGFLDPGVLARKWQETQQMDTKNHGAYAGQRNNVGNSDFHDFTLRVLKV